MPSHSPLPRRRWFHPGVPVLVLLAVVLRAEVARTPIAAAEEAAQIAALMANLVCDEEFQSTPFTPELAPARLVGGRWVWGDGVVAAPAGVGARVSFDLFGGNDSVTIIRAPGSAPLSSPATSALSDWHGDAAREP